MSKKPILDLIKERILILDGAMGSMLIAQGFPVGTPLEIWNIENPEIIKTIHKDYFIAGSDVVLTNTFGGSALKLAAYKHGSSIENYNSKAAEIALEVCPENGYVAGDIGPSGAFLPPVGSAAIEDFEENFLEQAQILAKAKVDFFIIETMIDINEAIAAVKSVKKVSNFPVFASIAYQKKPKGYFTVMGDSVEKCVKELENAGADVIGANCSIGSDEMIDLITQIKQITKLPIMAKPNAGKPELINGETIYSTKSADFAKDIMQMVEAGALAVGGCCGTSPEFIKEIKHLVNMWEK